MTNLRGSSILPNRRSSPQEAVLTVQRGRLSVLEADLFPPLICRVVSLSGEQEPPFPSQYRWSPKVDPRTQELTWVTYRRSQESGHGWNDAAVTSYNQGTCEAQTAWEPNSLPAFPILVLTPGVSELDQFTCLCVIFFYKMRIV